MNTVIVATHKDRTQQLYTKDYIRLVRKTIGFDTFMRVFGYRNLDEYNMDGTLKDWIAKEV